MLPVKGFCLLSVIAPLSKSMKIQRCCTVSLRSSDHVYIRSVYQFLYKNAWSQYTKVLMPSPPNCQRRHYVFGLPVRRVRQFVRSSGDCLGRSWDIVVTQSVWQTKFCYHDISWTASAISMKLIGN